MNMAGRRGIPLGKGNERGGMEDWNSEQHVGGYMV
jgi:hypothetical protein